MASCCAASLLIPATLTNLDLAFTSGSGPSLSARGMAFRRIGVGELAAGAIAGVLSAADAIRLTRVRGEAMADSCEAEPTGMTAVLGGDEAAVLAAMSPLWARSRNKRRTSSGRVSIATARPVRPQLGATARKRVTSRRTAAIAR